MIDSEIQERSICSGCYACANICPENSIMMTDDHEGFWYPAVNYETCTKCGNCLEVCPIINHSQVETRPVAYACINKDESVRLASSSGGMFTLITEQIIEKGAVVFGAGFNKAFEVEHSYVEKVKDLDKFRGSKYVQSKIGDTYKVAQELLESGTMVLFSGTPCQIGGLKSYIGKTYDNLFCIDLICHGVPSPKVWAKYRAYREKISRSVIREISFRRKAEGWQRYSLSFSFENDKEYCQNHTKDLYMQAFLKNICLRPSCYACSYN